MRRGRTIALLLAFLGVTHLGGAARSAFSIPVETSQAAAEIEVQSVSEAALTSGARAADGVVRIHQVGNPSRRPALPDLSREGTHALPGRVSLEVPEPGLAWGDAVLPPGIYRLSLSTDGIEPRLRAKPLAPAPTVDLPVEIGTVTGPAPQFTAVLGVRQLERQRVGHLSLRWGVLLIEASFTAVPETSSRLGAWKLIDVSPKSASKEETYLGVLEGGEGGARHALRWIQKGGPPRLRLELTRRRRLFSLRREYVARAERIANLARSAVESGNETEAARIGLIGESYEERAAQIDRSLSALAGTGREIPGRPRAARGEKIALELEERDGESWLIIDSPEGGAEFPLP